MVRVCCCCFDLVVQAEAEQLRRENARYVPCDPQPRHMVHTSPRGKQRSMRPTAPRSAQRQDRSVRKLCPAGCAGSWLRLLWRRKRTRWASDPAAALRCRPPRETSSLVRPMRSALRCYGWRRAPARLPPGLARDSAPLGRCRWVGYARYGPRGISAHARAELAREHAAHCCRLGAGSDRRASCTHAAPRPAA